MDFLAHANSDFSNSEIFLGYYTNKENIDRLKSLIQDVSWEVFIPLRARVYEHQDNFDFDEKFFDKNKKYAFFTDFHDKTFYLFNYFKKYTDLKLLMFDAHPDCFDDHRDVNYQNFVRHLIERGTLKPDRLMIVGIRNYSEDEIEFLNNYNIKYIESYDFFEEPNHWTKVIQDFVNDSPTYVSIDLDVMTSEHTNWFEPFGIDATEILKILKKINNFIFVIDFTEGKLTKNDTPIWKVSYYMFCYIAKLWCKK